jgi:hypothetical protein
MPTAKVRKRGEPQWGQSMPAWVPALPTAFEMKVKQLGLRREEYVYSEALRVWCEENRNRCYIPEWLLDAWDIQVDLNLDWVA